MLGIPTAQLILDCTYWWLLLLLSTAYIVVSSSLRLHSRSSIVFFRAGIRLQPAVALNNARPVECRTAVCTPASRHHGYTQARVSPAQT